MPKKKEQLSQKEQSKRLREKVQRLIDAGELNPTEAEARFEDAMKKISQKVGKNQIGLAFQNLIAISASPRYVSATALHGSLVGSFTCTARRAEVLWGLSYVCGRSWLA
jgi:hypothetical protein